MFTNTIMKKILVLGLFIIIHFHSLSAQETLAEMDALLARIDDANLDELEQELDERIEVARIFSGFFESPGEDQIKNYTLEEEKFEKPFKIDTLNVYKALHQFNTIGIQQSFRENKSFLKFKKIGDEYWHTVWMGEGMKEKLTPKTIFYKDGSRVTEGIHDNKISFFFEKPWGKIATIDSVQIDYNIRYTTAYDSLEVAKNTKRIKYKDAIITVKKLEKNYLYLTISDEYKDQLTIRALNTKGKFLNQNHSSFSHTSDNEFSALQGFLEDLKTKFKSNKFEDTKSFKKYLLKKIDKFKAIKDNDGVYHLQYFFEGNIESLRLFFETEERSKTITFFAKNDSTFGDIILMQNKKENIFLDANAKELFRIPFTPIKSLGSRYFTNDSVYYHLNLKTKNLDQLNVTYIWEATNGLAFIQQAGNDHLLMYNAEYKLLSDIPFAKLYALDDHYVYGIGTAKENYILSATGAIKKLEGITDIGTPFDDRIVARKNGKYGFITTSGEVAIPFEFRAVENFKNGVAFVQNEAYKYGVIDRTGKTIVPLIYHKIIFHKNGLTWISTEDTYQLINKDGKVLITEKADSYTIDGTGENTNLQFDERRYDSYGNLITDY